MTEQELVSAAQRGDADAFGALVEQNQARVYALAHRMVGDPEDASDLTQETFLRAWRGVSKFNGQSAFYTWLYRLCSNACIDFLRREGRRGAVSLTQEEDGGDADRQREVPDRTYDPQRVLERTEAKAAVERALAALSPEHRQALVLREFEGLSYQEIGAVLDVEPGTVKSRIARARLALRDYLVRHG